MTSNYYVSIAVLDEDKDYVALETISVMKNYCVLSGAWVLTGSEMLEKESLLSDKLILNISKDSNKNIVYGATVDISDFLRDAIRAAGVSRQEFDEFVAADPKKRKNLVPPTFFEWPELLNLEQLAEYESKYKIKMFFEDGQPEIKRVLAVSKLLQMFINGWHSDEQERNNRHYLNSEQNNFALLPSSWIKQAK